MVATKRSQGVRAKTQPQLVLDGAAPTIPFEMDSQLEFGDRQALNLGTGASHQYRWAVDEIREVRGFNPRIETAAYKAGIERLALEIAENGFDESQPLLVFPIREGSKTVLAVRDGHRRLQAVRLANHYLDDGKNRQIDQLPVIIEEWADPRSLTLSVMQRNDQLALTVFETAIVAFRAHLKLGMSTMEIASEFKRSEMHIKGLLLLANADRRIQDLVIEDKTTATTAIKAIRLYKDGAPERLVEVTAGKGKVRPRDLPGERLKRVMRKVGARLLLTIKDIEADPGFKRLRRETRESISDLLEKVREAEKEDPVDK